MPNNRLSRCYCGDASKTDTFCLGWFWFGYGVGVECLVRLVFGVCGGELQRKHITRYYVRICVLLGLISVLALRTQQM